MKRRKHTHWHATEDKSAMTSAIAGAEYYTISLRCSADYRQRAHDAYYEFHA